MVHIRNKYFYLFSIFLLLDVWMAFAQSAISEKDFRTNTHPRIFVTMDDKQAIQAKIELVNWARDIYEALKADVDPIIAMHQDTWFLVCRCIGNQESAIHISIQKETT